MQIIVNTMRNGGRFNYKLIENGTVFVSGQGNTIQEAWEKAFEDYQEIKNK